MAPDGVSVAPPCRRELTRINPSCEIFAGNGIQSRIDEIARSWTSAQAASRVARIGTP
jgi:hypothetical protein